MLAEKARAAGRLSVVPLERDEALAWIAQHHRHSAANAVGYKFALGAACDGRIVGAAIIGWPVARMNADGWTLEVLRNCTDGHPNACSLLYGAAWRAARAMGYRRLITYTLKSESGSSLRASGWRVVGEVAAASWDTPSRPRVDKHELQERLSWEVTA